MYLTLALVASVLPLSTAHSYVESITTGSQNITTWLPWWDPYHNSTRPTRPFANNSPITDVDSPDCMCNRQQDDSPSASKPAPIHATVAAGAELTFHWVLYPVGHSGPVLSYLARCPGRCEDWVLKGGEVVWFKFDEGGWYSEGNFASDTIAKTQQWTLRIPPTLKPGNYLLRHEAIALHSAESPGNAQMYIACHQFEITGSGTDFPDDKYLVAFPGAYKKDDPGLAINIHYPKLTSYTVPGPPLWPGGSRSNAATPHFLNSSNTVAGQPTSPTNSATVNGGTSPTPAESPTNAAGTGPVPGAGTDQTTYYTTILPSGTVVISGASALVSTSFGILSLALVATWVQ